MIYRANYKGVRGSNKWHFVCHKEPFVCSNSSVIHPFISFNIPFIGTTQNNIGFTLIELLITLTVASILLLIGFPSMQNFVLDRRLSAQATDLVTDVNFAKSEAVKQ